MVEITPNYFAYFALLAWPAVALFLYSRLPLARATIWTLLGGYLLLPLGTEIKIPMVPVFDKQSIPSLVALIGCAMSTRRPPKFWHGFGLAEVLILPILIGPFITSMLNSDPIRSGDTFIPGVGAYDAGSAAIAAFVSLVPFFVGRQFLRSAEDNAEILRALVIAGLAYSLPILFELRMSPQLNIWVYGYFPTEFIQQIREGGFRPAVFLGHGLLVAFFIMTTTVAAAAFWRTQTRVSPLPPGGAIAYLSLILVLCKTMGALVYSIVAVPLVRWTSPRTQLRVACVLAALSLTYPLLRVADLIPTDSILSVANDISPARAESLNVRFENEKVLLEHAWERPWFGWGRYGRNRVYNGWMGRDNSVTDGYWIITLGVFGLVGFAATFGLLTLAIFRAATALKFAQPTWESGYLAALGLIVAINIFDLLPNSSISSWTWLLVGGLLGRAETLHALARRRILPEDMQLSPLQIRQTESPSI